MAGVEQTNGRVHIAATQILPQTLPALQIGDILRMTVRNNSPQGQGVLYFQGQLIQASLPPELEQGDRLLARLEQAGQTVQLRLIEVTKASTPEGGLPQISPQTAALIKQIDQLLEKFALTTNQEARKVALPQPGTLTPTSPTEGESASSGATIQATTAQQIGTLVQSLTTSVLSEEQLLKPEVVAKALRTPPDNIVATLKDAAIRLREAATAITLAQNPAARGSLAVATILHDIRTVLINSDPEALSRTLNRLTQNIQNELRADRSNGQKTRLLESLLRELQTSDLQTLARPAITELAARLETITPPLPQSAERTAIELQQLAIKLDSLAASHETLQVLNPMLQAMGEPALLLFPFLFQGLLLHAEASIEPPPVDDEEGNKGRKSDEQFARIEMQVPLPSLGTIDVEVAYRKDEMMIRFNVENESIKEFLGSRLEHLSATFRQLNIELTQVITAVQPIEKGVFERRLSADGTGGFVA